jgi:hypothetical protein
MLVQVMNFDVEKLYMYQKKEQNTGTSNHARSNIVTFRPQRRYFDSFDSIRLNRDFPSCLIFGVNHPTFCVGAVHITTSHQKRLTFR